MTVGYRPYFYIGGLMQAKLSHHPFQNPRSKAVIFPESLQFDVNNLCDIFQILSRILLSIVLYTMQMSFPQSISK